MIAYAMSLRFFKARTLIFVLAGLAATSINSPGLKGLGTPLRAGRAGTFFFSILIRPGIEKAPGPRAARLLLISADNAAKYVSAYSKYL